MKNPEIVARALDGDRLLCVLSTASGQQLTLQGTNNDVDPAIDDSKLSSNVALVRNAWAFAVSKYESISLEDATEQKQAAKRSDNFKKLPSGSLNLPTTYPRKSGKGGALPVSATTTTSR
ncbi:hypothetical protein [Glutamicibacter sp. NPDC087344]|uniref:hypothetical protein n=1 Tax=Glutamicibacter sp. NPDC087344 TaxID=3363994 RepID=UPI0037F22396